MARAEIASASTRPDSIKGLAQSIARPAYRRLLNACRDDKLVTPGGVVVIQFHREPLVANCWQLEDLRVQLEERQKAAA